MANNTVTRTDLVEAIYEEVGLPRNECAKLLEDVLKTVAACLVEGEPFKVTNFGIFSVRHKGERMGRKAALKAIRKEINFNPLELGWVKVAGIDLESLIDAFVERHKSISTYFYSNYGVKLQKTDSVIAEKVIGHFTDKNIAVLCIHYSFVINPLYGNDLISVMTDAFRDEGSQFNVRDYDLTQDSSHEGGGTAVRSSREGK